MRRAARLLARVSLSHCIGGVRLTGLGMELQPVPEAKTELDTEARAMVDLLNDGDEPAVSAEANNSTAD